MFLGVASCLLVAPSWKTHIGSGHMETLSQIWGASAVQVSFEWTAQWFRIRCGSQKDVCWILSLFTYYWKGRINESPTPYPPTHPLKTHQVRRGSLHQLKRLHMEIRRKDRFQYIIFKKWYSQRFAPLLFYKILICFWYAFSPFQMQPDFSTYHIFNEKKQAGVDVLYITATIPTTFV